MEEKPITEFCSKIVTNTGVKDEGKVSCHIIWSEK